MASLASVRVRTWRKINPFALIILLLSLFGLFASLSFSSFVRERVGPDVILPVGGWCPVISLVAVAVALVFVLRAKPVYGVFLRSLSGGWSGWGAFGEQRAMATDDKEYAIRIANAVNEAIIQRG